MQILRPLHSASPFLCRSGPTISMVPAAGSQSITCGLLFTGWLTSLLPPPTSPWLGHPAPFPCFSDLCLLSSPIYSHLSERLQTGLRARAGWRPWNRKMLWEERTASPVLHSSTGGLLPVIPQPLKCLQIKASKQSSWLEGVPSERWWSEPGYALCCGVSNPSPLKVAGT